MKNAEFVQKLKEIGWIDNIAYADYEFDSLEKAQQAVLSNYSDPNRATGTLGIMEGMFHEDELYENRPILELMSGITRGDLEKSDIEHIDESKYANPQALFDDVNAVLAKKGIKKAFYILPRIDEEVFYVYKPIEVYQKALELGLITEPL